MSLYAGNLEDITLRALRVLERSDVIFSEDCRHTSKLTRHYGITTPRVSYHQHNEAKRNSELVDRLKQGQTVALVSDAGCPGVSDPGASAVVAAISAGCGHILLFYINPRADWLFEALKMLPDCSATAVTLCYWHFVYMVSCWKPASQLYPLLRTVLYPELNGVVRG